MTLQGLSSLQQDFCSLRCLYIRRSKVEVSELLLMLRHLSGLEKLQLGKVLEEPSYRLPVLSAMVDASPLFPKLKYLEVDGFSSREDKYIALLVRLFPRLIIFISTRVSKWILYALWEHCYYLKMVDNAPDGMIENWEVRRAKDAGQPIF